MGIVLYFGKKKPNAKKPHVERYPLICTKPPGPTPEEIAAAIEKHDRFMAAVASGKVALLMPK